MSEPKNISRRTLFKSTLSAAKLLLIANSGLYVVGSAFKNLDGSMVAGAKQVGGCTCGINPPNGDACSIVLTRAVSDYPSKICYLDPDPCAAEGESVAVYCD